MLAINHSFPIKGVWNRYILTGLICLLFQNSQSLLAQNHIWLEAECGQLGSNWISQSNSSASNSSWAVLPTSNGTDQYSGPSTNPADYLTLNFTANVAGSYRIYFRHQAPDGDHNSFWIRVNGGAWDASELHFGANLQWSHMNTSANLGIPVNINLVQGANTIEITHREPGAPLDKLLLSYQNSTVPWGVGTPGDNCTTSSGPFASMSASPTTGTAPLFVSFSSAGSFDPQGDPLTYSWTFGDGQTSNSANPTHTYFQSGTYTASLTIDDGNGNSDQVFETITVAAPPSSTSIYLEAECGIVGSNWQTVNDASVSNDSYVNYPSAPIANQQAPSDPADQIHYTVDIDNAGSYKMYFRQLSATIYANSIWVRINQGNWVACGFAAGPTYAWYQYNDNNDMGPPTDVNLNAGQNTIEIAYRESECRLDKIYITNGTNVPAGEGPAANNCTGTPNSPPTAFLTASPLTGFAPLVVNFDGSGSTDPDQDPLTYHWDFGNGVQGNGGSTNTHTYTAAGTYTATLTVDDGQGGSDQATVQIVVSNPPNGEAEIWLEAECGERGANWTQYQAFDASGEAYAVHTGSSGQFGSPSSNSDDWVSYDLRVLDAGPYWIYVRHLSPTSNSNSVWMRVNGSQQLETFLPEGNSYDWDLANDANSPVSVYLNAGPNTLEISHREPGTRIDKFFITQTQISPQYQGGNANNCGDCGQDDVIWATPTTGKNRIISRRYRKAVEQQTEVSLAREIEQEVEYYDGIGRAIQETDVQYSPALQDVVRFREYDSKGREAHKYLPYTDPADGGWRGQLPSQEGLQSSFYQNNFSHYGPDLANLKEVKIFEESPLNRSITTVNVGIEWEQREQQYLINGSNEVLSFGLSPSIPRTASFYTANTLFKKKDVDENGHDKLTYSDKLGRTILEVSYVDNQTPAQTYYIYDAFGWVAYILPPEATKEVIANGNTLTQSILDKWCFQFKHDNRRRMIEKKVPGEEEWTYFVYDKLDREVAVQDGNQREVGRWIFTKYDELDRSIMTGLWDSPSNIGNSRTDIQSAINAQSIISESPQSGGIHGYSNQVIPNPNNANSLVLAVSYYDDYDTDGNTGNGPEHSFVEESGIALPAVRERLRSIITVVKARVLDSNPVEWLNTRTFYNEYGQEIQTQSDHLHGVDIQSQKVNFIGEVEQTFLRHQGPGNTEQVRKEYCYDHRGRLIQLRQQVNDDPELVLAEHAYNELGESLSKQCHSTNNGDSFLENCTFTHNIRGFMTDINDVDASCGSTGLFSMRLGYNEDNTFSPPVIHGNENGNITFQLWRSADDCSLHGYAYDYDDMDRLTSAHYRRNANGSWNHDVDRYSTSYSYDLNGNIEGLSRNGKNGAGSNAYGLMDDLTLTYQANHPNRLASVSDAASHAPQTGIDEFIDGSSGSNEYDYDPNGNMTQDQNKFINADYNYLNKLDHISFYGGPNAGSSISYIYDALGNILQKTVNSSSSVTTDYIAGFHYVNGTLEFFPHEEGRMVHEGNDVFRSEYVYEDYLGNARLTFTDLNDDGTIDTNPANQEIVQVDHYYPFGQRMAGISSVNGLLNRYRYNGNELQDELGLNWYDYGARMYDPSVGRFTSVDPLVNKYVGISPFAYVANTPTNAIDPDGRYILFIGGLRLWKQKADQRQWLGGFKIHTTDVYDYWSTDENTFGRPANIAAYYQDKYRDYNVGFTSGSSKWKSQAGDREADGEKKAELFHEMVQQGKIKLKQGETIKVISHSQGGAHAAGYVRKLLSYKDENGNSIYKVEVIEYITPHQPTDINHPEGVRGIQYSHPSDAVSSKPPKWMRKRNGGSEFGKIDGISDDDFYDEDIMGGEGQPPCEGPGFNQNRCGHNVTDNDRFIRQSERNSPRIYRPRR